MGLYNRSRCNSHPPPHTYPWSHKNTKKYRSNQVLSNTPLFTVLISCPAASSTTQPIDYCCQHFCDQCSFGTVHPVHESTDNLPPPLNDNRGRTRKQTCNFAVTASIHMILQAVFGNYSLPSFFCNVCFSRVNSAQGEACVAPPKKIGFISGVLCPQLVETA
jgi:hypothetical protein